MNVNGLFFYVVVHVHLLVFICVIAPAILFSVCKGCTEYITYIRQSRLVLQNISKCLSSEIPLHGHAGYLQIISVVELKSQSKTIISMTSEH